MSAAAEMERIMVGKRVQAALVGLQELYLLQNRQSDMVSWALKIYLEEPVSVYHADLGDAGLMKRKEQQLDATLLSLKQKLLHLHRQDVGLKTHLQQLDQQINELKLDVSKASIEQLESDSRPSSGFYELSDGDSCSRSNSCASVYSECLSSSQTSLVPLSPTNCHKIPLPKVDVCCWRYSDESTPQFNLQWATGLHVLGNRIRASATDTDQKRPRPVSTGDLDKIMAQGLSYFESADTKPQISTKKMTSVVDPNFQGNLKFLTGTEVSQYPSPLHAVALKNPILSQEGEVGLSVLLEDQGAPINNYISLQRCYETRNLDCIDKRLQHSLNKIQKETGTKNVKSQSNSDRNPTEIVHLSAELSQKGTSMLLSPQAKTNVIPPENNHNKFCLAYSNQPDKTNQQQSVKVPNVSCRHSYPAAIKQYSSNKIPYSPLMNNTKPQEEIVSTAENHSDKNPGNNPEPKPQERKSCRQRLVMANNSEESQVKIHSSHRGSPEFVHAKFVPAGSQKVKVRRADHKTRAAKLKEKSHQKPHSVKQQYCFSSEEKTWGISARVKWELKRLEKGRVIKKVNACRTQEHKQCTGTNSILQSPGLTVTHNNHPEAHPNPVIAKTGKNHRLQFLDYEHPIEQRQGRQKNVKWQSDMNILQPLCVHSQRLKQPSAQPLENIPMGCTISTKSGHWLGSSHLFQPCMFSNSFLSDLNSKYPPAPFHKSGHYPPRCESEYSAECNSLFHSTIAESSDGEMSDNTTNRFGDSESSQSFHSFSDSDSRLSFDEGDQVVIHKEEDGGLMWIGQTLKQFPTCPKPSASRIKASRALKKKIRQFQPASLKVITLV